MKSNLKNQLFQMKQEKYKNQKVNNNIFNNKLLLGISGILLGSTLFAGIHTVVNFNTYPIPSNVTSKSRGGTLDDSVAISDGVGTLLVNSINNGNKKNESNKAYNTVIKSNLKIIKNNPNIKINDLITSNVINVANNQLSKINNNELVDSNILLGKVDGVSCDDNDPNTIYDTYTNGICSGLVDLTKIVSSQKRYGGGGVWFSNNNVTVHFLQGDLSKFMSGDGAGLCSTSNGIINKPLYYEYTLKIKYKFKHFYYYQYKNNYRKQLKKIEISCSNDDLNWTTVKVLNNLPTYNGNNYININSNNLSCKYWRIGVKDVYNRSNTSAGYCQYFLEGGFY